MDAAVKNPARPSLLVSARESTAARHPRTGRMILGFPYLVVLLSRQLPRLWQPIQITTLPALLSSRRSELSGKATEWLRAGRPEITPCICSLREVRACFLRETLLHRSPDS